MTNSAFRGMAAIAPLLALCACGPERPAGFTAALPPPPLARTPDAPDGAIYHASTGYAPLYYGQRASQVGDLVTVILVERTQTSKSASANNQRDGGISLAPPSAGPFSFDPGVLNSSGSSSFKGKGDAAQTSTLRGDLTVTIAEVRPNGTALVRGEKVMQLSQGEEWIQLSGIIRLADIDQDNRIASPRIADARITYAGKGSVQRASREGWLSRFFNIVTPF
ncbi:flagellar basal body L-ring protein FlgH [Croceibacterium aestuarii]|uniref:flagellar basal body L-ring protein FlgH n=1 Tax=Croceibacterium aestuarii TaxID=3064139 RepID=UPI00272E43BB|nr:flagellar basal body L-ring protein FlgH [Croceibacterium sp. D39]